MARRKNNQIKKQRLSVKMETDLVWNYITVTGSITIVPKYWIHFYYHLIL